ncbi:MAG: DUF1501 domain-containing protein [Planctomycetaceae bacterium]|nr:DUF1501 domain-containing protein [Planctomycetaceae bacterium]
MPALSLLGRPSRLCNGVTRREVLRAGGLGLAGVTLPHLLQASETAPLGVPPTDKSFGRAKNVIFLYLAGGPPQHETFDPKPEAPVDVRGPFNPISTCIPGMQFCELLPRTARLADRMAVIRSLSTNDNTHSSSSYEVLTGYKYQGTNPRTIQPTDWPWFGSIVKRYRPSEVLPPLSTVWIPDIMRLNESVTPAGQTAGFMGAEFNPDRFVGDPSAAGYKVSGFDTQGVSPRELLRRQALLAGVEQSFASRGRGSDVQLYDRYQQQAFELLTSGRAQQAFAIDQEPAPVRERYGQNRWGQCVLLARRLVEAGVRLVHVQWPREPGDNAVDNPLWDTHAQNADRVEDVLCPMFDVGYSALLEDLDERGLLDETLVVAVGEFGRTPRINGNGGRDHWGPVFSCALAGAGISGGQVYGSSDRNGAYPASNRCQPNALTATIFHLLGLSHLSTFTDLEGREHKLTEGEPLFDLLGEQPATNSRTTPTGDIARVPPYDPSITLVEPGFSAEAPLKPFTSPSRPKGWRADPILSADGPAAFGVWHSQQEVLLGLPGGAGKVSKGAMAVVAQEVRSPFAGTYTLRVSLKGTGSDNPAALERFARPFRCRLEFFQFTHPEKSPSHRKVLASTEIQPDFAPAPDAPAQEFELTKEFLNPNPGGNFSFGLGLGIALVVEQTTAETLELPPESPEIALRLVNVSLTFTGKSRNDKVKV